MKSLYIELGNIIKAKRIEKSLSQDELAYRCMLHSHCIYKIEKAKSEIKLSTLIRVFNELDLSFMLIEELAKKHTAKLTFYC